MPSESEKELWVREGNMRHKSILRILLIVTLDIIAIVAAGGVALFVLHDGSFAAVKLSVDVQLWKSFLPFQIIGTLIVYVLRRMYHYLWRSVGAHDVVNMLASVILAYMVSALVAYVAGCAVGGGLGFLIMMCQIVFHVGMRCSLRFVTAFRHRSMGHGEKSERIMLIGAGEAGRILLREIHSNDKIKGRVCCLIDDNAHKWGKYLDGVRIYGGRERIPGLVERERITQIILAMPTASAKESDSLQPHGL